MGKYGWVEVVEGAQRVLGAMVAQAIDRRVSYGKTLQARKSASSSSRRRGLGVANLAADLVIKAWSVAH
jgi:hypothetical protein